ncbi:MAG: accessory factor UbiK family protein [Rhodocyclaceae bacterium]|nr:accessory factor UbiK family protein [Rhodocyclaceae bacterium]
MNPPNILDQIGSRLAEVAAQSPARDIEKNVRALATSAFARLDLVTREEFDVQRALLERTQRQLAALEQRVAALEATLGAATD